MAGIRSRKTHAGLAAGIAASLLVAAAQGSHAADADDVTTIFVSDGQELADALWDSASSSKPVVITLLNDVSVEQPYSYVYGGSADLTIDGDDHMLKFDDASISISSSADPISVTIKDVTLVDVASPDSAVDGDDRFVSISNVGSVLVKNVTAQDSVLDATAHDPSCDNASPVPAGAPAGVAFPHGVFDFCVDTGVRGAPVTITVTFPSPVNRAYKVSDGVWTAIPGADISGHKLTYQITDGGPLDADGATNGRIVDPLAAGLAAAFTG